jgi:hypothetical protein
MYSQPPQVEFARRAEQSITLHQLLDRFSHRMREQVQLRGISVRPFFAVISLSPSCQLRACGPAQAKGMLHIDTTGASLGRTAAMGLMRRICDVRVCFV